MKWIGSPTVTPVGMDETRFKYWGKLSTNWCLAPQGYDTTLVTNEPGEASVRGLVSCRLLLEPKQPPFFGSECPFERPLTVKPAMVRLFNDLVLGGSIMSPLQNSKMHPSGALG